MSRVLDSAKEQFNLVKDGEKCLDSQLWHACAGGMVQMHKVNSKVYYFPQGHAEHAGGNVEFPSSLKIPPFVLCRVVGVKFMADSETDEVFVKIKLLPLKDLEDDNCYGKYGESESLSDSSDLDVEEKPASFAKTLTQSDANNGGGFSVPRYCAETIFPRLDYSADPPVQIVIAKDVHGEVWKFRHIYRGTPRRHLLTTGWSTFVNQKKLVAGDAIVFLRTGNGELCVGVRRSSRANGDSSSAWFSSGGDCGSLFRNSRWDGKTGNGGCGGFSMFLKEDGNRLRRTCSGGFGNSDSVLEERNKVSAKSVIEAAHLAATRQPFEVVYYPRASSPEYCVKASAVNSAMRMHWTPGMRFKMPFETEDSSRISWFMGTISSVNFADPINWPNSPWRLLQVAWDEPDLLQNVKRVNPWLLEVVSNMPTIQFSPFTHPKKKLRVSHHPEFPLDGQGILGGLPAGVLTSNMLGQMNPWQSIPANVPSGIQGARQSNYGISLSDIFINKRQLGLFPDGFDRQDHGAVSTPVSTELIMGISSVYDCSSVHDNLSCHLNVGNSSPAVKKSTSTVNGSSVKSTPFLLFGIPIHTEQQQQQQESGVGSTDGSGLIADLGSTLLASNGNLNGNLQIFNRVQTDGTSFCDNFAFGAGNDKPLESTGYSGFRGLLCFNDHPSKFGSEKHEIQKMYDDGIGHCKVFMESEDVGRSLDLSLFGSYDELYKTLASMFSVEELEMFSRVLYRDNNGTVRHTGDEPYSEFVKTARRLTILSDAGSDNLGRR